MNLDEKLECCQRGYALVDLDAIVYNMQQMKANVAEHTKLMGIIKTDGYGHGSVPIARILEPLDFLYGFGVATAEEAFLLRDAGIRKPLLVLGYTFPYAYERMAREDIRPAVFRYDTIEQLQQAARRAGKPVRVHIKVDTGMNRIGITPDQEGIAFADAIQKAKDIEIEGIFTHFARADERDKTSARRQLQLFQEFVHRIEEKTALRIPVKHCSNSAGILELPEANMDVVRAGITLYGLYPSEEVSRKTVPLRPALSLYSHIVYVKMIPAGSSISYGGTFTAGQDMRVATIPVGYGDGYPRSLSGKGYVLIRGMRAPILGRVCMDQLMADVSHIPEAAEGDLVVLLGQDKEQWISAEELGELSGRFNYELVCDLGKRIPRVYVENGRIQNGSGCAYISIS